PRLCAVVRLERDAKGPDGDQGIGGADEEGKAGGVGEACGEEDEVGQRTIDGLSGAMLRATGGRTTIKNVSVCSTPGRSRVAAHIKDSLMGLSEVFYGVSDPEFRKSLFRAKWLQFQHESEKQSWPRWKRLIHRLQRCPVCRPPVKKGQPGIKIDNFSPSERKANVLRCNLTLRADVKRQVAGGDVMNPANVVSFPVRHPELFSPEINCEILANGELYRVLYATIRALPFVQDAEKQNELK